MSDVLQDAEAILNKAWHYPEDAYAAFELLPGLVAEIKRLQASEKGSLHDFNQMVEQLAKWQQIAIEERAKATYYLDDWSHFGEDFQLIRWENAKTNIRDHYMGQAAKELGLVQEASYVERLEKAFVTMYFETHWRKPDQTYEDQMQEAQAALAKIREAKV